VIRPPRKLIPEINLPPAIESGESGDRTIDVAGFKVVVISKPLKKERG